MGFSGLLERGQFSASHTNWTGKLVGSFSSAR